MLNLDDLRRRLATPLDTQPGPPATAGQVLWHAMVAAGHTPAVHDRSAGRAITLDLPDNTGIWITEQADITHPPDDHESWTAIHLYDPNEPGAYHLIYEGADRRGLTADTAACVKAITAWTAAHTATGAVARHNAHLALPRTTPRNARRATWQLSYGHPGYNGIRPATPTGRHTATRLDRWPDDRGERRGACLACPWEGPIRRRHNHAIEDALDHTHPGWRDLPVLPQTATRKSGAQLRAHRDATYPSGWFDNGGPSKVLTTTANDRHEAGKAPGGGYLVKVHQPRRPEDTPQQLSLL
ncbi:DUF6349 family protein [Kitasatospora sp. NPDC058478]|uniref:DUF6349 family protein n=1 Tax=unclassified Kitasatospora TaxID=2633591 RepID=UPI0036653928